MSIEAIAEMLKAPGASGSSVKQNQEGVTAGAAVQQPGNVLGGQIKRSPWIDGAKGFFESLRTQQDMDAIRREQINEALRQPPAV